MAEKQPEVYIADDDGYALVDGIPYYFKYNQTTVEAGHPLLKASPASFRPFSPQFTKAQHAEQKRLQKRPAQQEAPGSTETPGTEPDPELTAA